jgi:glycerol-3-phosphate O-acyltransferase
MPQEKTQYLREGGQRDHFSDLLPELDGSVSPGRMALRRKWKVKKKVPPHEEAFPYEVDFKPSFFLSSLLYRLFKRTHVDKNAIEKLRQLHRQGTVVYAIKYAGRLDFLLYHFRFRIARMPFPKMAFDLNMSLVLPFSRLLRIIRYQVRFILKNGHFPSPYETGFYRKNMEQGITSLISLVDPKGFSRRFIHAQKDNLSFLLEFQKKSDRPIYIVPLLVLYKKTPEKEFSRLFDIFFGFKDQPGTLRKIVLFFRHNRRAVIDFGPPLDLKAFLQCGNSGESHTAWISGLRSDLITRIDEQKRVILGPIMKSHQQLKEIVLNDPEIEGTVKEMGAEKRNALKKLRKKASDYFNEIAADYNFAYVQFFQILLKWFWKKLFEGIDVSDDQINTLRESARKGVLIYVPSHKSHIDYLVLNYILLEHHMHVPRVAAGKNLAFWPMGYIFRKSGAFFIRRTFRGARLYAKIFSRYIKALLAERHPLEFFIEGGRSRSGKMILPKIGFLSILLEAFQEGYCEDLFFVPVSIAYDRILEEKSYIRELSGLKKEKETFLQMIKARQFLKRRYGKIYIRFASAISLREYINRSLAPEQPLNKQLGLDIIRSINQVSLVTPVSLVAAAILSRHRKSFTFPQIMETAMILLQIVKRHNVPIASTFSDPENAIREAIFVLVQWKQLNLLEEEGPAGEEYYTVDDNKKLELAYYKNSIIHFFLPRSFVAIALLTTTKDPLSREEVIKEYAFLTDLFKNEFVLEENQKIEAEVTAILQEFLQEKLIQQHDEAYVTPTRLGLDQLPVWGNQIKSFLESYWIVARVLLDEKGVRVKKSERLKNIQNLALKYQKIGIITCRESLSEINFKNALGFFEEKMQRDASGKASDDKDSPAAREDLADLCTHLHTLCR